MLRRASGLLLSFATCFASLALSAHVLNVVAFDPGRPARVLAAMLETDEGKDLAAEAISAQLRVLVPRVDPDRADAIGIRVAGDPELIEALRSTDGRGHGAAVDVVLETVAQKNPRLARIAGSRDGDGAGVLPSVLSDGVVEVRTFLGRAARNGTLLALTLTGLALVVGPRRDRMMRMVGRWCVSAAALGFGLWLLLPDVVLPHVPGRWPVVVAAGLHAAGGSLAALFGTLLLGGLVAFGVAYAGSFLVPVSGAREVPEVVRQAAARRARERAAAEQHQRTSAAAPYAPATGDPDDDLATEPPPVGRVPR